MKDKTPAQRGATDMQAAKKREHVPTGYCMIAEIAFGDLPFDGGRDYHDDIGVLGRNKRHSM